MDKSKEEISKKALLDKALFEAVASGDLSGVVACLDDGANIEARLTGLTPLHCAVMAGNAEVVRTLIERKADINAENDIGVANWRPLHYAMFNGHRDIVWLLIDKGAKVDTEQLKVGMREEIAIRDKQQGRQL